jgi:saccharopine dehydrogenase-like NADP-dependent oxidoreductase
MNILIFGAGYSAKAFARERNPRVSIAGTTRSSAKFDTLRDAGISPLVFDGVATPELLQALADTTHLVISIAPDDGGDPVLGALANKIKAAMPKLRWIGYLSTVGVYGDHQGAWVT